MQVITVNQAPFPGPVKSSNSEGRGKFGEADLFVALIGAMFDSTVVEPAQGKQDSSDELTSNLGLGDLILSTGGAGAVGPEDGMDRVTSAELPPNQSPAAAQNPHTLVLASNFTGTIVQQPANMSVKAPGILATPVNAGALAMSLEMAFQPEQEVFPPGIRQSYQLEGLQIPRVSGLQDLESVEELSKEALPGRISQEGRPVESLSSAVRVETGVKPSPVPEDMGGGTGAKGTGPVSLGEAGKHYPAAGGSKGQTEPVNVNTTHFVQVNPANAIPNPNPDGQIPPANAGPNPAGPLQPAMEQPLQPLSDGAVRLTGLEDRIVREIKLFSTIRKGDPQTQVHLKLEPEHLGQLTIKLFFNRGEVNAHFYAGNSYVKEILEGSLQQLREALGQQELRLNEALVFTGDGGRGGTGRFFEESSREAVMLSGPGYRTNREAKTETVEAATRFKDPARINCLV